jgi:hypothetical protein
MNVKKEYQMRGIAVQNALKLDYNEYAYKELNYKLD